MVQEGIEGMELRTKISDIITNELFERFESPSSAVIAVQLADRILAIPEIAGALEAAEKLGAGKRLTYRAAHN
jgi:hypothetical protein